MRKRCKIGYLSIGIAVLFAMLGIGANRAYAQPVRPHIYLPSTRGATATSTYIDAHARHIVAVGDFLESAAIARRHHAAAADKEMDNSIKWVETYFKRREINRAYRRKENPPYLDKVAHREKVKDRRVRDLPLEVLKGDVTDELNWLLDRLATASLAYDAIYGSNDEYVDSEIDQKLPPLDIQHIVLTDGGKKNGQKLTFRAHDAKVLDDRWPVAFRAPEMRAARERFERARDKGLKEIRANKELSYTTWTEMKDALNDLAVQLVRKYPLEYRKYGPFQEWLLYDNGRRFIKAQVLAVHRAMATNRLETFDGSNRFTGDSVFDLIRHMCRRGLNFSTPEAGDGPTYEKLLIAMRHIYLDFYDEG